MSQQKPVESEPSKRHALTIRAGKFRAEASGLGVLALVAIVAIVCAITMAGKWLPYVMRSSFTSVADGQR